jgi:hypothetical protein
LKVSVDVEIEVSHVQMFRNHIEALLHMVRVIIEVIPHISLILSPKQLITTGVGPFFKVIWIFLLYGPPMTNRDLNGILTKHIFFLSWANVLAFIFAPVV